MQSLWISESFSSVEKKLSFPAEFLCDPVMRTGRTSEQNTSTVPEITPSAATAISASMDKMFREVECSCWCNKWGEKIENVEDLKNTKLKDVKSL